MVLEKTLESPWTARKSSQSILKEISPGCSLEKKVKVKSLSRVRLFVTPWTVAYQAPPSMGFSRQECWSGVPFPCAQSLGREDLLEKGLSTYSSILAWKVPRMEEPGGLQSMGSQRVGHD